MDPANSMHFKDLILLDPSSLPVGAHASIYFELNTYLTYIIMIKRFFIVIWHEWFFLLFIYPDITELIFIS